MSESASIGMAGNRPALAAKFALPPGAFLATVGFILWAAVAFALFVSVPRFVHVCQQFGLQLPGLVSLLSIPIVAWMLLAGGIATWTVGMRLRFGLAKQMLLVALPLLFNAVIYVSLYECQSRLLDALSR